MQAHEKEEMLALMASGRQAIEDALQGVTEEVAKRSPAPERWSILDCVEHIAIVEGYLLAKINCATPGEPMVNLNRESKIRARAADRGRPVSAPAEARPSGRFPTLADAMQHFLATRECTIHFIQNCPSDLRAQITTHPLIGTVNCYETLLLMAAHPQRHADQIREVRRQLGQ